MNLGIFFCITTSYLFSKVYNKKEKLVFRLKKVIPSLWFEQNVIEVFEFYTHVFEDIKLIEEIKLHQGSEYETDVLLNPL